MDKLGLPKL